MSKPVPFFTITFLRHGESEQNLIKRGTVTLNAEELIAFRTRDTGDHRLSTKGVEDAQRAGNLLRLHHQHFDVLATSTFTRAQETLLETGLRGPVEISPLIDERFSGDLEYLLKDELQHTYPTADHDRDSKETRWRPPNGESMRDTLTRTLLFVEHMKQKYGAGTHILVVTHSRVMSSFMWWAEQLEDHEVPRTSDKPVKNRITNGAILQYRWDTPSGQPSHKRVIADTPDPVWHELPRNRFTTDDLRHLVKSYPRILRA